MLLAQEYIHTAACLENLQEPVTGGKRGNARSWMCRCLGDALGSVPIWAIGSRRVWTGIKAGVPGGGITQGHLHWLSSQPANSGPWGHPGLQLPASHLHSVFFLSAIFFLKTTCGNKLVLEGRVLSLVSFWLEIYSSVHVLCSCTWQSGVCSAVHSPANLVS